MGFLTDWLDPVLGSEEKQSTSVDLGQAGAQERWLQDQGFADYAKIRNQGNRLGNRAQEAGNDFASMLRRYSQGGFMPSKGQMSTANKFAQNIFAPQRTQLAQSFQDQIRNANRQAGMMGRRPNDPILAAKLGQEQMRQQSMLNAQQGSFAQQYAMQMPQQQLDYAGQLASVRQGLASQAMQNRMTLLSFGNQLKEQDRNFRLSAAGRTQTTPTSGLVNAIGIANAGANIAKGFSGVPSGGK
jgi:hypothetical protein